MKIQIINIEEQQKLHQFTPDELILIKLGSNPNKFDKLIFRNIKNETKRTKVCS